MKPFSSARRPTVLRRHLLIVANRREPLPRGVQHISEVLPAVLNNIARVAEEKTPKERA